MKLLKPNYFQHKLILPLFDNLVNLKVILIEVTLKTLRIQIFKILFEISSMQNFHFSKKFFNYLSIFPTKFS
jgi:hypothetical protein